MCRSAAPARANPSAALGLVVGVAARCGRGYGWRWILELLPFSLLINFDQHNAQYVSWQISPLVAHWILKQSLALEKGGERSHEDHQGFRQETSAAELLCPSVRYLVGWRPHRGRS